MMQSCRYLYFVIFVLLYLHSLAQDGRLKTVTVYGYQKRYDLEKYYIYILQVRRQNQPDPAYLFRSYKEFVELHQKLLIHFPLAKLHRCVFSDFCYTPFFNSFIFLLNAQFLKWHACWKIKHKNRC